MFLKMNNPELIYIIGLSMIPGIGSITARKLISSTGSAESVFHEKKSVLRKIPGIGDFIAGKIFENNLLHDAEKEIRYMEKNFIKPVYFKDKEYPVRLNQCPDGPILIYVKGDIDMNNGKFISIVGTRTPTSYGIRITNKLVEEFAQRNHNPVIVSGLAYGIDICAHKAAMNNHFRTIAVLGHGMKYLYPLVHSSIARKIEKQGALITDFPSNEKPERNNFIKRNRIIAGLSDATIIIESGIKGGALITADLADSYHRDVFAVPGRAGDQYSSGTNLLIKKNIASLAESCEDIEYLMGWGVQEQDKAKQAELFNELPEEEQLLLNIIYKEEKIEIDLLCIRTGMPVNKVSAHLLNLEFAGLVESAPGNIYSIRKIKSSRSV
jgi:DNA processing protein